MAWGSRRWQGSASVAPSINNLTNFFTLYVVPMFFFSGVFYPVDGLPEAIQRVAWILPLTWATELMRSLAYGEIYAHTFLSLAILIAFTVVFIPLSIRGMRRRLNQVAPRISPTICEEPKQFGRVGRVLFYARVPSLIWLNLFL